MRVTQIDGDVAANWIGCVVAQCKCGFAFSAVLDA